MKSERTKGFTNGKETEKFDELKKRNAKEKEKSAPQAKTNQTVFALSHMTGQGTGGTGHQLAVVAYRDEQLY